MLINLSDLGDYQNILVVANFIILLAIFIYAYYLYSVDKKIRGKYSDLQDRVEDIISEANKKSIEILTKSDYMSNALRKEVTDNFERIIDDLKKQNKAFYSDLAKGYEKVSTNFVSDIKKEAEKNAEAVGENLKAEAASANKPYDEKLAAYFESAKKEIDDYKAKQFAEIEADLKSKASKLSLEIIPEYISADAQERLVSEVLRKLKSSPVQNDSAK